MVDHGPWLMDLGQVKNLESLQCVWLLGVFFWSARVRAVPSLGKAKFDILGTCHNLPHPNPSIQLPLGEEELCVCALLRASKHVNG